MGLRLSDVMRRLRKARRDRITRRAQEIRKEVEGSQAFRKATANWTETKS
jgi:hypothetical protein